MGGPSLRQLHAHHAIHQGGLSGAITKTEELEELLAAREFEVANQAAEHLIEYWETRILSHADAEEEGFYEDMISLNSDLLHAVTHLKRDHDLLRIIVRDVKETLREEGIVPEVMQRFHALLVLNAIHSRDEERLLFAKP